MEEATAALKNHKIGHYKIKAHLYKTIELAKRLRLKELETDPEVEERINAPRSRDQFFMRHVDDKSSSDDPSVPLQASSSLERFSRAINGNCDYVEDRGTMYIQDSTKAEKNTDCIINELLIDILATVNGEKHAIFVFDCGPLNVSSALFDTYSSVLVLILILILCNFSRRSYNQ